MALRDQPYLPLYVQDFLTDEKLAYCSAEATGVYIRIMCLMHKSEKYGVILLKQMFNQTPKQEYNFACQLAKQIPYDVAIIERAILELVEQEVLNITGVELSQKRMVKDGIISEKRSISGKTGGVTTQKNIKNFAKAKNKANSENENANENVIDNNFKGGTGENSYTPTPKVDWLAELEKSEQAIQSVMLKLRYANCTESEAKELREIFLADRRAEPDGNKPDVTSYFLNWVGKSGKAQLDNIRLKPKVQPQKKTRIYE